MVAQIVNFSTNYGFLARLDFGNYFSLMCVHKRSDCMLDCFCVVVALHMLTSIVLRIATEIRLHVAPVMENVESA